MAKNIRTRLEKLERKHNAPRVFFLGFDATDEERAAARREAAKHKGSILFDLRLPPNEESDDREQS